MAWQTPKTNWRAGEVVSSTDLNRIEGNINYIEQEPRTPDQNATPTSSGPLGSILSFFAAQIKKITGKTNWYDAPSRTLEDLNSHINAAAPHSGHALVNHTHTKSQITDFAHTHSGGDITSAVANATNADTVDGKHATEFVLLGATNQDINFVKALMQRIDTRSVTLTYDGNNRLTQVVEKDGTTTVKTTSLTYDTNGNLTQVREVVGGKTVTTTLSYDGNGNLTSVSRTVV